MLILLLSCNKLRKKTQNVVGGSWENVKNESNEDMKWDFCNEQRDTLLLSRQISLKYTQFWPYVHVQTHTFFLYMYVELTFVFAESLSLSLSVSVMYVYLELWLQQVQYHFVRANLKLQG